MLDFGVGVGMEMSGPHGYQSIEGPSPINFIFFYDLKKSIIRTRIDFCKAVKCSQQLILSKWLAWRKSTCCPGHHHEMDKQTGIISFSFLHVMVMIIKE